MNETILKKIEKRRIELGYTQAKISQFIGLSRMEYYDLETYPDEIFNVVDLGTVKKLLEILQLDLFDTLDLRCAFCVDKSEYREYYDLPRNLLIQRRREDLHYSKETFGDIIGFYEETINCMEQDAVFLETWPIGCINNISKALNVPFQILAAVKCNICNK